MRTCNSTYNKCLEENSFKHTYHMHLPISEWARDWNIRKQGQKGYKWCKSGGMIIIAITVESDKYLYH